jgi:hypothetical protein
MHTETCQLPGETRRLGELVMNDKYASEQLPPDDDEIIDEG